MDVGESANNNSNAVGAVGAGLLHGEIAGVVDAEDGPLLQPEIFGDAGQGIADLEYIAAVAGLEVADRIELAEQLGASGVEQLARIPESVFLGLGEGSPEGLIGQIFTQIGIRRGQQGRSTF